MKHLFLIALVLALSGCLSDNEAAPDAAATAEPPAATPEFVTYGTIADTDDAQVLLAANEVIANPLDYADTTVRVEGTVSQVCQKKGCWVSFQGEAAGTNLRIMVPRDEAGEYVYTFPMDLGPVRMIAEGVVSVTEMDPETVAHYESEGAAVPPAGEDGIVRQVMLVATGALVEAADPPEGFVVPEVTNPDEA
ncbi:MAG: DUF4920 domain-containing protein [Bacteroidota bacterium]